MFRSNGCMRVCVCVSLPLPRSTSSNMLSTQERSFLLVFLLVTSVFFSPVSQTHVHLHLPFLLFSHDVKPDLSVPSPSCIILCLHM